MAKPREPRTESNRKNTSRSKDATRPVKKSTAKPLAKSAGWPASKSAERTAQRVDDRPAQQSYARPAQSSGARPASAGWPASRSAERPAQRSSERTAPKFTDRPAARSTDRPASRSTARPTSKSAERAVAARAAQAPRPAPAALTTQGARISRRAADRIRAGHAWVYASDVEATLLPEGEAAPALVPVADNRGLLLGTALYSPTSQIQLRMVAREAIDEAAWLKIFAERLRRAIARRKPLLDKATDSCRLVFSEADELPGLVVDKYNSLAIVQLLAKGLDSAAIRAAAVRVLSEELDLKAIFERPDARMRELEGLSAPATEALWTKGKLAKSDVDFHLNGLSFQFDANSGQKTGAFLDQRLNYAAAAATAKRMGALGRALDVCTYQGGFALHLAQFCERVTGVDQSHASLEVAEKNLAANKKALKAEVDWIEADAFQLLREWSDAKEQFDTIVLDPPAFAKSKRAIEGALRGYKELNLRALHMIRPGGLLVSCSCSHHVSAADLEASIASAAADAGRRVRLLERRGAALDHPVLLSLPESEYLKCILLEVE